MVRFATEEYEKPSAANKKNKYKHLTNYAINKYHSNYRAEVDSDELDDSRKVHKRSMLDFFAELADQGYNM